MSRWHNGPNGPGVCRAKSGNCPFGGEDSHFDSKEEAGEVYNEQNASEFGILPGMSNDKKKDIRETKITASNSSGVVLASSNYVKMSGKGNKHDTEYIHNKLKSANMDSDKMVDSLNNDDNIYGKWKLKEESDDKITLENKDAFGNTSYLNVRKVEPKVKKSKPGQISAAGANGISMSLSNYVSTGPGGNQEAQEYFQTKIGRAKLDSAKMVRYLNADKRIRGKWSLENEDENAIKLKNEDVFGNTDYISITKK